MSSLRLLWALSALALLTGCSPEIPDLPADFGVDVPLFPSSRYQNEFTLIVKVPGSKALERCHAVRYALKGSPINVREWYTDNFPGSPLVARDDYWVLIRTPQGTPPGGRIEVRIRYTAGNATTVYEVVKITPLAAPAANQP